MPRLPRGSTARAAVLVVTIIVVVAGVSIGPGVFDIAEPDGEPAYDVSELVPERAASTGEVAVERRNETGVVLIDIAHGNRMSQAEIKPLLAAITDAGYEIDLLERGDSFDRSLARADAFVVIDPSVGYSDDEVTRVEAFVDRGGRLLLVGEPTTSDIVGFSLVERVNRLTPLSSPFGFEFGEAYLFNMGRNDGNHLNVFVEPAGRDRLTRGVDRAAFYTATRINIREGRPLLVASDGTRSSRTDATGTFAVAAVNGNVLALADGSFLRLGNFNVVDNEALVRNVVGFLVSGEKRRSLDTYPTFVSADPVVRYTRPALVDAAQDLATDLRAAGAEPTLRLRQKPVSPNDTDVLVTTFAYLEEHGQLGTGIRVTDGVVGVRGYSSPTQGIIVVRAPANGYDLVVVADTPARAERAVHLLTEGTLRDHLLDPRTAVVRTGGVVAPEEESEDST